MEYEVLSSDGIQIYLIRRADGQYGLINTTTGSVQWADNPEHFLRFLCLNPLERPLSQEQMAELDNMLEGRAIPPDEHEWDELEQMILDMGFVPMEDHEAQQ